MRQIISALLFCLLPAVAMSANVMKYDTLRMNHADSKVTVTLDLTGPVKYKYFSLSNPDRFVVDLPDTVIGGKKAQFNYQNSPVKSVRAGIRKGTDLRLVFDLSQSVKGKALVKPIGKGQHRQLVVEFDGYRPAAPAKSVTKSAKAKPTPKVSKKTAPKPVVQAKRTTKPAVKQTFVEIPERDIVVAIDAGHGGVDPGASGRKGTKEKDVVLAIARQLEAMVKKEPGMRPLMIRDGDYFLSLSQRMEKARRHQADIFISIHADAFPDHRAHGSSVYTLSEKGESSAMAKLLAERENAADLFGTVALNEVDESLASILVDMSQSVTIEASMDVANRVLSGLKGVGHVHKRHVQQAGFAVLKSPDIPSILIETAFISNPKEEQQLRNRKHQRKMAVAILDGVRSYFSANPVPGTRVAAREHVIKRGETLSRIAQRYQVSTKLLRTANNLKTDFLRVGQVLQIPIGG